MTVGPTESPRRRVIFSNSTSSRNTQVTRPTSSLGISPCGPSPRTPNLSFQVYRLQVSIQMALVAGPPWCVIVRMIYHRTDHGIRLHSIGTVAATRTWSISSSTPASQTSRTLCGPRRGQTLPRARSSTSSSRVLAEANLGSSLHTTRRVATNIRWESSRASLVSI